MAALQNTSLYMGAIFVKDFVGIGFLGSLHWQFTLGQIIGQINSKALISSGRSVGNPETIQKRGSSTFTSLIFQPRTPALEAGAPLQL